MEKVGDRHAQLQCQGAHPGFPEDHFAISFTHFGPSLGVVHGKTEREGLRWGVEIIAKVRCDGQEDLAEMNALVYRTGNGDAPKQANIMHLKVETVSGLVRTGCSCDSCC